MTKEEFLQCYCTDYEDVLEVYYRFRTYFKYLDEFPESIDYFEEELTCRISSDILEYILDKYFKDADFYPIESEIYDRIYEQGVNFITVLQHFIELDLAEVLEFLREDFNLVPMREINKLELEHNLNDLLDELKILIV